MTLSSTVRVRLAASQTGSNDFGGPEFSPEMETAINLQNGTGAGQADLLYVDERSVAASSNDDIDLNGVLAQAIGGTFNAVELVALIVINAPKSGVANLSSLTVGGATNPFIGFLGGTAPTIGPIGPGGHLSIGAPGATGIGTVTPATADQLRIANGAGGTAVYQIAILGRTA